MRVKLLVVQGRPQGKSLQFPCGEFVIGRGTECHIRPNSFWVSRQNCILRVTDDSVHLRDLGSRNGTLINGSRVVGERHLAHGDRLQVGPLVFQVCLDESSVDLQATGQVETGVHCIDTAEAQSLGSAPSEPPVRQVTGKSGVLPAQPPAV